MNTIRSTAIGLLAVAPLALAACSSGSSKSAAPANPAGAINSALSSASKAASAAATDSSATSATAGSGGGGGAGFCSQILGDNAFLMDLTAGDAKAGGVGAQKILDDMQKLQAEAPSAIKSDIGEMVTYIQALVDKAKAGQTADNSPDDPKLDAAMQHYIAWVNANCQGK
jgi:hypothetical protein